MNVNSIFEYIVCHLTSIRICEIISFLTEIQEHKSNVQTVGHLGG